LGRCIDSALGAPADDVEVLVSDDASTDESWAIIGRYEDPRIHMWRHESRLGVYCNCNFLLRQARGRYVKVLAADDWLEPCFFAEFQRSVDREPEIVLNAFNGISVNAREIRTSIPSEHGLAGTESSEQKSYRQALSLVVFAHPTAIAFRRTLAVAAGGYTPENVMRADLLIAVRAYMHPDCRMISSIDVVCANQLFHDRNDRYNYSALDSIGDELTAASLVLDGLEPGRGRVRAWIWKAKAASHGLLHLAYEALRRRSEAKRRVFAQTLRANGGLVPALVFMPVLVPIVGLALIRSAARLPVFSAINSFLYR
jgi:glycosyltransferase involved in cell wall biosynthesis